MSFPDIHLHIYEASIENYKLTISCTPWEKFKISKINSGLINFILRGGAPIQRKRLKTAMLYCTH